MANQGLLFGQDRKRRGLDRVEENESDALLYRLRLYAINVSNRTGQVTIDDVRAYADRMGFRPHHQNVWGTIFRPTGWKHIGFEQSARPGNHARRVAVWRWDG